MLNDSLFGFAQVDIEVPEELKDRFSEMAPFFVVDEITEVPEYMEKYREETGRKENKNARKTTGCDESRKNLTLHSLVEMVYRAWFKSHSIS